MGLIYIYKGEIILLTRQSEKRLEFETRDYSRVKYKLRITSDEYIEKHMEFIGVL